MTDVFRAIVAADHARLAAPLDNLIQYADHPHRRQRKVNFNPETFPVEVVQHVEQPEAATIDQRIVHEVDRPHFVDPRRHRQRLRYFPHQPFLRLDPQVQLQLPADPAHPLVVPGEILHVAQMQEAQPEPPVPERRRQSDQPVHDQGILIHPPGHATVRRLAQIERLAGMPDAGSARIDHR